MEEKKITISDVARTAGVSKSTVSNYLNKRYDRMKEETKDKIQAAIDHLDYVPSISARRLSAKEKSKTIGLIIPENLANIFDTMYYPTVFGSVGKAAEKIGYSILIYVQNKREKEEQMEYLLGLGKSLVDGFLIFSLTPQDRYFEEFEKNNIPYVCVGKIADFDDYHYVATDHGLAVKLTVKHLADLGHKRIAMVTEDRTSVVDTTRHRAYIEAMRENNLEYQESYYYSFLCEEIKEQSERFSCRLLQRKDRPTAIIVPANMMRYLKMAVKQNDLYIPQDLSVVALEYYERYSEYVTFQNMEYTRVPSQAHKVSSCAFEKLVDIIENPEGEFTSLLEPAELKIGKTTGTCKE